MGIPKRNNEERNDKTTNKKRTTPLEPKVKQPQKTKQADTTRVAYVEDANRAQLYRNKQNMYNNTVWGVGFQGRPTNYNPANPVHQGFIDGNFNVAKNRVEDFFANIAFGIVGEGARMGKNYATAAREIGRGAEQVVTASRIGSNVTKTGTPSRGQVHLKNSTPSAQRIRYKGYNNGQHVSTQAKVTKVSGKKEQKALSQIIEEAKQQGYKVIESPYLYGPALQKRGLVYSDLLGNIGINRAGKAVFFDSTPQEIKNFKADMLIGE